MREDYRISVVCVRDAKANLFYLKGGDDFDLEIYVKYHELDSVHLGRVKP